MEKLTWLEEFSIARLEKFFQHICPRYYPVSVNIWPQNASTTLSVFFRGPYGGKRVDLRITPENTEQMWFKLGQVLKQREVLFRKVYLVRKPA